MSAPFDRELGGVALEIARKENFPCHRGVLVAVAGPNLETRAEYRFLRQIGADVVGMSTVPEVIVAVHAGLRTLGLSVVTDMCLPDNLHAANVAEIIAIANAAEPKLTSPADGGTGSRGEAEEVGQGADGKACGSPGDFRSLHAFARCHPTPSTTSLGSRP